MTFCKRADTLLCLIELTFSGRGFIQVNKLLSLSCIYWALASFVSKGTDKCGEAPSFWFSFFVSGFSVSSILFGSVDR